METVQSGPKPASDAQASQIAPKQGGADLVVAPPKLSGNLAGWAPRSVEPAAVR